jgi:hypothetical protein
VRVADSHTEAMIQLGAVENHLSRMHRFHGGERDRKVAGVLDVDHQLGPTAWCDRPNGAELFATIRNERLKPYFDALVHNSLLALLSSRNALEFSTIDSIWLVALTII